MSMTSLLDARTLTQAINKTKVIEPYFLNNVFKNKQYVKTKHIDIETISNNTRLARYVNDHEKAIPISKSGRTYNSVKLPRTYEMKFFGLDEIQNFKSLGAVYGDAAVTDRNREAALWVAQELQDLKERAIRRDEMIAAMALFTGSISIVQDNIEWTVDYGYEEDTHLIELTGEDRWNDADNTTILEQLRQYKKLIKKRCGIVPRIVILGSNAATALLANADIKALLDNQNYRVGAIDLTRDPEANGMYLGTLAGMQIFEYDQQYENYSGTDTDMIDSNKMLMLADSPSFRQYHGAIYRLVNGNLTLVSNDMFVESRTNDDQTAVEWRVEHKALPVIHDPDCLISATVVAVS